MSANSPTGTRAQQMSSSSSTSSDTISPSDIQSILLADGWHTVSNCEYTEFAVSSDSSPTKGYPAISFTEGNKNLIIPLRHVLAFQSK